MANKVPCFRTRACGRLGAFPRAMQRLYMVPSMEVERGCVVDAIRRMREGLRWRPEKDIQHLAKRIELGHLPVGTTLAEYEAIIIRTSTPRQPRCLSTAGAKPSTRPSLQRWREPDGW